MASGSAQGSSTGTEPRRWTLRSRDEYAGWAVTGPAPEGWPDGPGESVEVVEVSAPSERDIEAAVEVIQTFFHGRALSQREGEYRRLAERILSAVPSRPGGDAERLIVRLCEAVDWFAATDTGHGRYCGCTCCMTARKAVKEARASVAGSGKEGAR